MLLFKKLHPDAIIPTRATLLSAGFDLFALEETHISPMYGSVLVHTGIAVRLPAGTYGRIAMRSGLSIKQHLAVSAGVIDQDYRGTVGVVVFCTGMFTMKGEDDAVASSGYTIKKGERFAQLVVEKYSDCEGKEVEEFPDDVPGMGHGGFGSTGKY